MRRIIWSERRILQALSDNRETRDTIRRIYSIKVVRAGDKVRITYYGSGFMYHMARILTGTLIEVGAGKREASNLSACAGSKRQKHGGISCTGQRTFPQKSILLKTDGG